MAYIRTNFGTTKTANGEDPTATIAAAQQQRKKARDTKLAAGLMLNPLSTLVKTGIDRKTQPAVSEEEYIRAIVKKVLIEHGLLNPHPFWENLFR